VHRKFQHLTNSLGCGLTTLALLGALVLGAGPAIGQAIRTPSSKIIETDVDTRLDRDWRPEKTDDAISQGRMRSGGLRLYGARDGVTCPRYRTAHCPRHGAMVVDMPADIGEEQEAEVEAA